METMRGLKQRGVACSDLQVTNITLASCTGDHWKMMQGFRKGDAAVMKNLPVSVRDTGSIPRSGRCPGVGNGSSLQYSCLGNPMDRGAWQAAVYGVAELDTAEG